MSDQKNPSLNQGSDFSAKSVANTDFNTNPKYKLGQKLVQELMILVLQFNTIILLTIEASIENRLLSLLV